jgi:hypothetical protein
MTKNKKEKSNEKVKPKNSDSTPVRNSNTKNKAAHVSEKKKEKK